MGYKLLGMLVWKGGKAYVRYRYDPTYSARTKPIIAGGLVVALIGVLVLAKSRNDSA